MMDAGLTLPNNTDKQRSLWAKNVSSIVCVGDSITHGVTSGAGDRPYALSSRPYPLRLAEILKAIYPTKIFNVTNAGIDGETAQQTILRFGSTISGFDAVILMIGANNLGISESEYQNQLEVLIKIANNFNVAVCLCSILPQQNSMQIQSKSFGEVARQVAAKYGCKYADVGGEFARIEPQRGRYLWFGENSLLSALDDLVHPVDAGFDVIAATIAGAIANFNLIGNAKLIRTGNAGNALRRQVDPSGKFLLETNNGILLRGVNFSTFVDADITGNQYAEIEFNPKSDQQWVSAMIHSSLSPASPSSDFGFGQGYSILRTRSGGVFFRSGGDYWGNIEPTAIGRNHNLRIEKENTQIRCFSDGKLILDTNVGAIIPRSIIQGGGTMIVGNFSGHPALSLEDMAATSGVIDFVNFRRGAI